MNGKCDFTKSRAEIWFIQHINLIGVLGAAFLLLAAIPLVGGFSGIKSPAFQVVGFASMLLVIIAIGIRRFHLKFAYRIVIDTTTNLITFYLYRDNKDLTYSFEKITRIYVNGYIYITTPRPFCFFKNN